MPPETFLFAAPATLAATLVAALFGLLIGSFLNVVAHRLPIMSQRELENYIAHEAGKELPHQDRFNLMVPRSRCPHCGHQITSLENIPVISWLVLRGKCSACKAPISARYPVVEAVTGLLSAALIWHFGSGWVGLASLGFAYLLIAMTLIDYDTKTLPDDLTYPLLWLGLLVNLNGAIVPLRDAVIGAVAGYMVLWTVNALFELVRGVPGMGNGDFKLLAALGAWLGWAMLPTIIILSSVVGALVGLSLILFAGRARDNPIPFGPYLAAAGMIALFYGIPLTRYAQGFLQA
jgi:leader peptidase (prepilin peptidase)/N-methyltransferase